MTDLLAALKQIDEVLRHNPDASEPPRYRNARAAKIAKEAIAEYEASPDRALEDFNYVGSRHHY